MQPQPESPQLDRLMDLEEAKRWKLQIQTKIEKELISRLNIPWARLFYRLPFLVLRWHVHQNRDCIKIPKRAFKSSAVRGQRKYSACTVKLFVLQTLGFPIPISYENDARESPFATSIICKGLESHVH